MSLSCILKIYFIIIQIQSVYLSLVQIHEANLETYLKGCEIEVYIYRWYRSVKAFKRQILRTILRPQNSKCIFFAGVYSLSHPWDNSGEKFEGQRIQSMISELTGGALQHCLGYPCISYRRGKKRLLW